MKYDKIKNLSNSELRNQLLAYKKEYFNLRFQKVLGELTNTFRIKAIKKNIAKVLTALSNLNKKTLKTKIIKC